MEIKQIKVRVPVWGHDAKTDRHTNLFMVVVQYMDDDADNVQFDIRLLLQHHLSKGLVRQWSTDVHQGLVIAFGNVGKDMPKTNDFDTLLPFEEYLKLMVDDKDVETILKKLL